LNRCMLDVEKIAGMISSLKWRILNKFIMWYMQKQLEELRRYQDTPYVYIKGTDKDYPKYLMYTDDKKSRNQMHSIY
jgi:hypothetical protein